MNHLLCLCGCVTYRCWLPQRVQFCEPPAPLRKPRHLTCPVQNTDALTWRQRPILGLRPCGEKRHLQRFFLRGAGPRLRQDVQVWPHPSTNHRKRQKQPAGPRKRDDDRGRVREQSCGKCEGGKYSFYLVLKIVHRKKNWYCHCCAELKFSNSEKSIIKMVHMTCLFYSMTFYCRIIHKLVVIQNFLLFN